MRNKIYLLSSLLLIFIFMFLFSCGRSNEKKHILNEIKQIKTTVAPTKIPSAQNEFVIHKYEANEAIKLRSPFETAQSLTATQINSNNILLRYPLSMLRFIGTLTRDNQILAYILTPDNKIVTTSIGEVIGSQNAKVIKIDNHQMQLLLQIVEPGKPIKQETITLQIKGGRS